ncbi:DUF3800 domain-containing protein [Ahrensia kielensis]|uniref:DUF3800 domain-containing protein n=1 Tax=Ahrensia kielensis TaxID=76980 RepID=UPI0003806B21|nr:DUF3800 domain-containing protein [Ahrensia kielensis]
MKYTLYIDESGEAGINKVRTDTSGGATPYMTLGACLVPSSYENKIADRLARIQEDLNRSHLHCSELSHPQKVYYARTIAKEKFLCFGMISEKRTLGAYSQAIEGDSTKYYNKCAQYLLERVGLFLKMKDIEADDVSIFFEEANFNYSALMTLINRCQENPINEQTKLLRRIDHLKIRTSPKGDKPSMQIADLVAHSLFKSVDKSKANFHIPETRYLNELRTRFFNCPETAKIINFGIKPVHKLPELKLDDDVHLFFKNLKAR